MLLIFLTPVLIRHLWPLKTVVFPHWCLIRAVLLPITAEKFYCTGTCTEKVPHVMTVVKVQKEALDVHVPVVTML